MKPQFSTVRRSTRTGYVGSMSNWSGTPRQLVELNCWTRREPESTWWFRHLYAACVGATVALFFLTR